MMTIAEHSIIMLHLAIHASIYNRVLFDDAEIPDYGTAKIVGLNCNFRGESNEKNPDVY